MKLSSSSCLSFTVDADKALLYDLLRFRSGFSHTCRFLNLSEPDEIFSGSQLKYFHIHSPLNRRIKVDRKDQINITLIRIFYKQRRFCIHEVEIHFLIIDHTERIDQEFRVESD